MSVPARSAKPATGVGSVLRIKGKGDSLLDGQGGSTRPATALPSWLRWVDNSVALTNYPDTSPVPQAGALAQLADEAHAAGFESVEIFTRALSAQEIPTVDGYARQVHSDMRADGVVGTKTSHISVWCCGTNDSQTQAEADAWYATVRQSIMAEAIVEPGTRVLLFEPPVVSPGPSSGHQHINAIKAYMADLEAEFPDLVRVVSGVGLDLGVDLVHLLATGYDELGTRAWAAYEDLP